jgi:beta-lactamase superfamily II metal-dependent hydrolase
MDWDGVRVEVLHPTAAWVAREVRPNENSVVLRVSYGRFDALLTGDVGLPVESLLVHTDLDQVELLKVGHHGSAGSTGSAWLAAVAPRIAVISVGRNDYGHPADAVLHRLDSARVPVYRTDRGGTVTIQSDGLYLAMQRRTPHRWFWRLGCPDPDSSPSKASSSSRNGCSPKPPGSSRTFFTTWPSPPR